MSSASSQKAQKHSVPTVFVILGATGDLMAKKIIPALFSLHEKHELPPHFRILGVSRRDWSDDDLERHIEAILSVKAPHATHESIESFLKLAIYHKLTFDSHDDYVALKDALRAIDDEKGMCSNKILYLSVPPQFYSEILNHLDRAGLAEECAPGEGWTRIVIEKPFGNDEKTAKALDAKLGKIFNEGQIYRVDHYLAKETFQNVLAFRFYNNLFETNWGKELIEKVYVRELENVGVEDRGPFYDPLGALRDVGQNHMLQMAALVAMDQPENLSAEAIRKNRAAILETLKPLSQDEIKHRTFRAQYEGYRSIKGVAPNSQTETYFRARFSLDHPRWDGVQFIMEAGKRIIDPREKREVTEIEVLFRHPSPCLCPPGNHYRNRVVFRQDPHEGITIHFWAKKPGHTMEIEEQTFEFDLRKGERKSQYTEEYEKLLLDVIEGDQTLFISSEEIRSMWRFVDPIEHAWKKNVVPLRHYVPDSPAITIEAHVLDEQATRGKALPREIGIFGLGKMGANVARQLREKGWRVIVSNRSPDPIETLRKEGFEAAFSQKELVSMVKPPRVIWMMITAGKGVDTFLFGEDNEGGLVKHLRKGDIVIDAANSFYEDTMRRAKLLRKRGIRFMDVGFSGGPAGARHGGSLMVGGDKKLFEYLEPLFADLSVPGGYAHFGDAGAGHFVKMVHNGIEYGMMQSLAEGFALMKKAPFKLDLAKVTNIYNHGSVIESRLVGWLEAAFKTYGQDLKTVSGSVAYTGEGEWTVKTGKKWHMKLPTIEDAFKFRVKSKRSPSYMGKILSALRNQFGGHAVK